MKVYGPRVPHFKKQGELSMFRSLVLLFCIVSWGRVVNADSPFVDQVAPPVKIKERGLDFETPLRIVMRSDLGIVVRGELLWMSNSIAKIVPDRQKFKNPEGVDYQLTSLQSLTIPELELKWSSGEDADRFLTKLSETEGLMIRNLAEFRASAPNATPAETSGEPTTEVPGKKIITMQPAKVQPVDMPTVTIICGSCLKEVSLSSDSGQVCPHCGILWDSSPLNAADLSALKTAEMAALQAHNEHAMQSPGETSSNVPPAAGMFPQQQSGFNVQPGQAVPNGAPGPQPVAVPAPIQHQAQPQELTLENLPLWLKGTIFAICLGVMYYTFFYIR